MDPIQYLKEFFPKLPGVLTVFIDKIFVKSGFVPICKLIATCDLTAEAASGVYIFIAPPRPLKLTFQ